MKRQTQTARAWLFRHTRRQLPGVLLLTVLNALLALTYLWLALLSKELIDAAGELLSRPERYVAFGECLREPSVYVPALLIFGAIAGQVVLHMVVSCLRVRTQGRLEIHLREQVFSSLLRADYAAVHARHSGELLTRLTSDAVLVAQEVTGLLPSAVSMLTKLLGGLIVLAFTAPGITLLLLAAGAVVVLGSHLYGVRLKKMHKKCQEAYGKTRSFLQEALGNLLSIKAFARGEQVQQRLADYQQRHFEWKLRRNRVQMVGSTAVYVLMTAAYYLILMWCVFCLVIGTMTVGTLTALLQIFEQLQAPLRGASGLMPRYYSLLASAERLYELDRLEAEPQTALPASCEKGIPGFRKLVISHVSFAYEDAVPVLRDVCLEVSRGECVPRVGASGIGKSTLMKLILSVYSCREGELYLDCGAQCLPITVATRKLIAYVPQGNTLMSGTIRENVSFFRRVEPERLQKAARLACLEEVVESLPQGWDTPVGEHGFGLSEGQAQRVAIARALVEDVPVLLLDECTSALDVETEARLLNNLRGLTDKAVLLISHREAAVHGSDRVWKLADGRLIPPEKDGFSPQ